MLEEGRGRSSLEQRASQVLTDGRAMSHVKDATHNLFVKSTRVFGKHNARLMKIDQLPRLRTKSIKYFFQLVTGLGRSFTKNKTIIGKKETQNT